MSGTFIGVIVMFILTMIVFAIKLALSRAKKKYENSEAGPPHRRDSYNHMSDYGLVNMWHSIMKWTFRVFTAATIILFVLSVITMVSTKKVGVVTTFGKPTGTLSNGLHLKAPWDKVTEFDAAIQTDKHEGKRSKDDDKNDPSKCTIVRIGNQSTACVDNSIRWRIKQDAADDLFRDYRDFDNVRDSLVTRQLTAALNEVFGGFDPLNSLDEEGKLDPQIQQQLADDVLEQLQAEIGDQIDVLSVFTPFVEFDSQTQDKINQFQAEVANTRIAEQRQKTAEKEAIANKNLSDSVSRDPNVLVSKCLDTLNDAVKAKMPLPAGFSCWPGDKSAIAVGVK